MLNVCEICILLHSIRILAFRLSGGEKTLQMTLCKILLTYKLILVYGSLYNFSEALHINTSLK